MQRYDYDAALMEGRVRVKFRECAIGDWVKHADAQAAIDAANERATEAERRLALAVAEVQTWRWSKKPNPTNGEVKQWQLAVINARRATDADPVLAKMIGGGE